MIYIGNVIMVIIFLRIFLKDIIYKVQRIDRLQQLILLLFVKLPHISLTGIEQYPLLKFLRPNHLHLHKELPSFTIFTANINNAILLQRIIRNKFYGNIFHRFYLMIFVKG